jgi:hypothetical protein
MERVIGVSQDVSHGETRFGAVHANFDMKAM